MPPTSDVVFAIARTSARLFLLGMSDLAAELFDRVAVDPREYATEHPDVAGHLYDTRAIRHLCRGDPASYLAELSRSAACYERAGDHYQLGIVRVNMGFAFTELGACGDAIGVVRRALADAEDSGMAAVAALARNNLGRALCMAGDLDEAIEVERAAIAAFVDQGDERLASGSRVYLARAYHGAGRLADAEREARAAVGATGDIPTIRAQALAQLAAILIDRDDGGGAAAAATEAFALHESLAIDEGESSIRLVYARVLDAQGSRESAVAAIADARARLLERAAALGDSRWRESFLGDVPEHAETLRLYERWTDDA